MADMELPVNPQNGDLASDYNEKDTNKNSEDEIPTELACCHNAPPKYNVTSL